MYVGLFGVIGLGVVVDFYLWEVNGDEVFDDATIFGHLLNQGYYTVTHIQYAVGVYVIGESTVKYVAWQPYRSMAPTAHKSL